MSQWISVDERLPEQRCRAFVAVDRVEEPQKATYNPTIDRWNIDGFYGGPWEVTHWMPLPPPPGEPCTCMYSHEGDMDTIVRHNPACPAHGSGQAKQGGTGIAGVAE